MLSSATKPRPSRILLLLVLAVAALTAVGCAGAPSRGWSGPLVSDNVLYVGTLHGKIVALDLATADPSESPVWDPMTLVARTGGSAFTCGRVSSPMGIYGTPAVKNGRVYIGGYDGNVQYVTTNGEVSGTKFETDGPIVGSVVIDGDTLYVGSSDGNLYALSLDLKLKEGWPFKTGGKIWSTPVVDHNVVYVASADHNLYAIDAESGNEIWRFETKAAIMSTPLVANGKVYIGGCDRRFYAIEAATEEQRAAAANGASPMVTEPDGVFEGAGNWFWTQALYYDGEIWVGCLDHRVYVLNAENVEEQVHDAYSTGGMVYAPPVVLDGQVVVGSQDGMIYFIDPDTVAFDAYAIDPKTHEVVESTDKPKSSPAPILAPMYADPTSGILYLHAQDGTHTLYAFKPSTKEVLWYFQTDKIR